MQASRPAFLRSQAASIDLRDIQSWSERRTRQVRAGRGGDLRAWGSHEMCGGRQACILRMEDKRSIREQYLTMATVVEGSRRERWIGSREKVRCRSWRVWGWLRMEGAPDCPSTCWPRFETDKEDNDRRTKSQQLTVYLDAVTDATSSGCWLRKRRRGGIRG